MPDRPLLLIGFDSAWSANNEGAIVQLLKYPDGSFGEIDSPDLADFNTASRIIVDRISFESATSALVLIDQPVVVRNDRGQRPVERIVSPAVSRRRGGMQPANTSRTGMFGPGAPIGLFCETFDPIETYPVQVMMALDWVLEDERPCGRLPKYNPANSKKFRQEDWRFVCDRLYREFEKRSLQLLCSFTLDLKHKARPRKHDQDFLDACICLLVAIQISESHPCISVGQPASGSIVSPYGYGLYAELAERCVKLGLDPQEWIREYSLEQTVLAE